MNHALQGVNAGYITKSALLEDHLRRQQERIADSDDAATLFRFDAATPFRDDAATLGVGLVGWF
jgi:hypothetical protein